MKYPAFIAMILLAAVSSCNITKTDTGIPPVKIIFDTDLGPDYDDVGALAFLHSAADSGHAEILATVSSNLHELVAPNIEIINGYFGRPELPIGAPKTGGVNMTAVQGWPDSLVSKYPHKIRSTDNVPDAVYIYRKILASQPDTSVTIVTVGFVTNLANLLKSQPDSLSPLSGAELAAKKVRLLVSMAGAFPGGREFNVFKDSTASEYVFNEWPGKIIFSGFEIGSKIFTGLQLIAEDVKGSPVKDVYKISLGFRGADMNGRMSWDQTAVMIAVYGTEKFFGLKRGNIIVNPDGSNTWEDNDVGKHYHVVKKMPFGEVGSFIEERMMHKPVRKN